MASAVPKTITIHGETRPVSSRLGPRHLDWQLTGDPAASWAECERHAKNILGPDGWKTFQAELRGEKSKADAKPAKAANPQMQMFGGDEEDQPLKGKRGRKKKR